MNTEYLMDIRVRDALKKEVVLVLEDTDIENINEIMLLKRQDEVLVKDDNQQIVGIVTKNDLTKSLTRGIDRKSPVRDIMTSKVIFMPPHLPLFDAKTKMRSLGISRAPVMDDEGNLLGLLTGKSICDGFSSQLEKVVMFQKLVMDSIKTAICILDVEHEILAYNKTFEKLFSPMNFPNMNLNNFLPGNLVDEIKRGKHPMDDIYFEGEGDREFTLSTRSFEFDEKLKGLIVNIEEISNLVKLIKELDKTSHKLSSLEERLNSMKGQEYSFGSLVSKNPEMIKAIGLAKKIAPTMAPLLIKGESGTGKELLANAVHENSGRKNCPMIKVNCAAIPQNLFESELFGYEEGAFTGASRYGKTGLLELADKGTIFLDEIGELPMEMQAKLLRFLQDQTFYKVGGTSPIRVDVRIISATNKDLEMLIQEEKFREDLYYRINVITIDIPPLRKRSEDIIGIVNTLIKDSQHRYGKRIEQIDSTVLQKFLDYSWPGNVRELKNVIERMVILSEDGKIKKDYLPKYLRQKEAMLISSGQISELDKAVDMAEKQVIYETLEKFSYNKTKTAKALKISRSTLYNKLKQYSIKV